MNWDDLTEEQKETVKGMVSFCLNRCYCLGMDEGYNEDGSPTEERSALKSFSK